MSIGLLVCYRDREREDRLVSVASDAVFLDFWIPICSELGLRWLPRFSTGWLLSAQDAPHLLEELRRLERYLSCGETHAEISAHMLGRISSLVRELIEIQNNSHIDAYIGPTLQIQRRPVLSYPAISHSSVLDSKAVSSR